MTFNIETNNTPFGALPREDRLALITAWLDGRRITMSGASITRFDHIFNPSWYADFIYRAEPTPLIPTSFDFVGLASKWQWCAADQHGAVYVYTIKPRMETAEWWAGIDNHRRINDLFPSYVRGTVPWQETLIERKTQPECTFATRRDFVEWANDKART